MILRARHVVTMDGPPIENGAVALANDRVIDVGAFDDLRERNADKVVDLGEQVLLPGLINAHCHLDYTCLRGKIERQEPFTAWIRAINAERGKLSRDDYFASLKEGFAEAKRFGTTTVINLTGVPSLIAKISKVAPPIRTWWFPELIDVRESVDADELIELAMEAAKATENWGLAPHAPYTASANLYRRCESLARNAPFLLTTHLAESREEMSMFRDGSGVLYDFLKWMGRDMSDCGKETPLSRFLTMRDQWQSERFARSDTDWIVAHLNELAESDLELLARSTSKFHVVHCPRSHEYFGHSAFQFGKLRELGFNICFGTDSLASNDDLNLFAEMRAFQKIVPDVSPEEILAMATVNPAKALGKPHLLGRIRANYAADLIAVPVSAPTENISEAVVAFDGAVTFSMVNGVGGAVPV